MIEKILFVDDEPQILDGYRRQLGRKYRTEGALSGDEALERITTDGPFAVIVCDMNMPGMDGVQLLTKIREICPDCVRIMLTGAENATAIEAVNQGHIFRFISKPCTTEDLDAALDAGLKQFRQIQSEKLLLSSTLGGAVRILTSMLAAAKPVAFERSERVRVLVKRLAGEVAPHLLSRAELATMLSQIGCVGLPDEVLSKAYAGKQIAPRDAGLYREHPKLGADLLRKVPRLDQVADIILQQDKNFDGTGFPKDNVAGEKIPLEARLIKVANDMDTLMLSGVALANVASELNKRVGVYDKVILDAISRQSDTAASISA